MNGKILVDADACPVKKEIEDIGRKYKLEIQYFVDVNHRLEPSYGSVVTVDQGADAVDLALINAMKKGDIIVSQDYGVASLAIGKGGKVMLPSGKEIHKDNIDLLMFERHISRVERSKGNRGRKHKKRTKEDNTFFLQAFEELVKSAL